MKLVLTTSLFSCFRLSQQLLKIEILTLNGRVLKILFYDVVQSETARTVCLCTAQATLLSCTSVKTVVNLLVGSKTLVFIQIM